MQACKISHCKKPECCYEVGSRVLTWLEGSKLLSEEVVLFLKSSAEEYTTTKFCQNELNTTTETVTDLKGTYVKSVLIRY